jgi:hypothetical protein
MRYVVNKTELRPSRRRTVLGVAAGYVDGC